MVNGLVLVTGCAKSGTHYIQRLLRACGMDIVHEGGSYSVGAVNRHTANWKLAPQADSNFDLVLHQVRHPVRVIESVSRWVTHPGDWRWIRSWIPLPDSTNRVYLAMVYWVFWNLLVEPIANYRYRIEDIDLELDGICDLLGLVPNRTVLQGLPRNIGSFSGGKSAGLTLGQLHNIDMNLTELIVRLALRYGYSEDELLSL